MTSLRLAAFLFASTACGALAAPTIEGCPVFPANNVWNARVDHLPVHARSSAWVANVNSTATGATRPFHMDFGSGLWEGAPIGIPYVVVNGTQPKVPVTFDYDDESDPGPYPIPPNAPIEGVGPPEAEGDRHVLVIDRDNCILYETFYSFPQNGGASWTAGSGAIYNLNVNGPLRPSTWTSADAAGLPIFPGLARYEEVAAGVIQHALRFTAQRTHRSFIWPARHQAGHTDDPNFPPMGARFRLKASYDISGFSPQARAIAQAMKTYGIILADNGSPWYVSGIPNAGWDNDQLHELDALRGGDFEAVDTSSLMVDPNSGQAAVAMHTLAVEKAGASAPEGTVTATGASINCGTTCSASVVEQTVVTLTANPGTARFAGWYGACSGTATCTVTMNQAKSVVAVFVPPSESLVASPTGMPLCETRSMGTSSVIRTFTIANVGSAPRNVTSVTPSTGGAFTMAHDCGAVAPGASCLIHVTFSPPATAADLNGSQPYMGQIHVASDSSTAIAPIQLCAHAEKSLVDHYYRAILNREPDANGKNFWRSESARLASLGVNINEAWFVMAGYFFNSAEYLAAGKSDTAFVTDLYNTFFNRAPDSGGLNYWVGQIAMGLPREVVLFSFMFSPEFRAFTQAIFGNTAARPEVDMVVDFFRGLLNRLPDTASFNFWLAQLRAAQCQGAGPVFQKVDEISAAFMFNTEYTNRARSNTQFVTDMYYSFLRRGGDVAGVQYWINQVSTPGSQYYFRNDARYYGFLNSPEFGARVQAVIDAGCLQ
ncbi:MAG TPA: DUF4214 domain-containing protein [Usitatibacter sp.]|nr:DUF4214 domain-containing protein [Usitatibacter sp.]